MEASIQHTERRRQILEDAYRLFMERGYESTTVKEIIDEVGIAKGTFYHYFPSKEELLAELAQGQFERAAELVQGIVDDPELSALEKFRTVGEKMGLWKLDNLELILQVSRTLYRPENLRLRHAFQTHTKRGFTPLYARIIAQGVEEGVFRVTYPEETAEMIMSMSMGMSEEFVSLFLQMREDPSYTGRFERRLWSLERSIERLLGAEEGTLRLFDPGQIGSFIKGGTE